MRYSRSHLELENVSALPYEKAYIAKILSRKNQFCMQINAQKTGLDTGILTNTELWNTD